MLNVVDLTRDLVRIPSMNPMGRGEGEGYGEAPLAAKIADVLQGIGAEVQLSYPLPNRPNLVARIRTEAPVQVLFEAHMDTVPVDNMTIDPFAAEMREGKIWGRGAADEKGPLAAMLCAIERAAADLPSLGITFVGVCDEEYQFHGVHAFLAGVTPEQRSTITFAVIAEPTLLQPVVAHKGVVRWVASAAGKPAHSSTPHLGRNAIYTMARFITDLETYADELQKRTPHTQLGVPTLSVGTIKGGTAVNIVPDLCSVEIDRRLIPGESPDCATQEISVIAKKYGITLSDPIVQAPALYVAEDSLVARACLTAGQAWRPDAKPLYVNYCTDGTFYPEAGIDAVVFGPGSIEQAHTADEWIAISELENGVEAYYSILKCAATAQQ
jgi:acetylornithine deacetylase/succinyl-diaminopimelate desuccinylase-like protein